MCRVCKVPIGKGIQTASSSTLQHPCAGRQILHMHIDLVGPLPVSSEGHMYLLTAIDRLSRCVKAVPLCNMEASPYTIPWPPGLQVLAGQPLSQLTEAHSSHLLCRHLNASVGHSARANYLIPASEQQHGEVFAQTDQGCPMCMWSRSGVAFPSPLGAVRTTCSAKGGLHGVFSRVGSRTPFHTSMLAIACARPPTC